MPLRSTTTKSNHMTSQKRAGLNMAIGYAGAWLLVWTPYFVPIISWIVVPNSVLLDTVLVIFVASTLSLQGFFNFVVFMAPKVRTTKMMYIRRARTDLSGNNNNQNQQHLTWCQAFYKAYMHRGRRLEDGDLRTNNLTERMTSLRATVRKISEIFRPFVFISSLSNF
jgi:hypothetical protein